MIQELYRKNRAERSLSVPVYDIWPLMRRQEVWWWWYDVQSWQLNPFARNLGTELSKLRGHKTMSGPCIPCKWTSIRFRGWNIRPIASMVEGDSVHPVLCIWYMQLISRIWNRIKVSIRIPELWRHHLYEVYTKTRMAIWMIYGLIYGRRRYVYVLTLKICFVVRCRRDAQRSDKKKMEIKSWMERFERQTSASVIRLDKNRDADDDWALDDVDTDDGHEIKLAKLK